MQIAMNALNLMRAEWFRWELHLPRLNDEQGYPAGRVNGKPCDPGIYSPKAATSAMGVTRVCAQSANSLNRRIQASQNGPNIVGNVRGHILFAGCQTQRVAYGLI
jgi:hypothetical protein